MLHYIPPDFNIYAGPSNSDDVQPVVSHFTTWTLNSFLRSYRASYVHRNHDGSVLAVRVVQSRTMRGRIPQYPFFPPNLSVDRDSGHNVGNVVTVRPNKRIALSLSKSSYPWLEAQLLTRYLIATTCIYYSMLRNGESIRSKRMKRLAEDNSPYRLDGWQRVALTLQHKFGVTGVSGGREGAIDYDNHGSGGRGEGAGETRRDVTHAPRRKRRGRAMKQK